MNTTQTIDTAEVESRIELGRRAREGQVNSTLLGMVAEMLREGVAAMLAAHKAHPQYDSFGHRAEAAALELVRVESAITAARKAEAVELAA